MGGTPGMPMNIAFGDKACLDHLLFLTIKLLWIEDHNSLAPVD